MKLKKENIPPMPKTFNQLIKWNFKYYPGWSLLIALALYLLTFFADCGGL